MDLRRIRHWTRRLGRRGENAAVALLRDEGCPVLARNCRPSSGGELDIVARDGDTLVFVEVKTRLCKPGAGSNLRMPQKERICRGAAAYLHDLEDPELKIRFDLIEVMAGRFGIEGIWHRKRAFSTDMLRRYRRRKRQEREG